MYPLFWTTEKGVFLCATHMNTKENALNCIDKGYGHRRHKEQKKRNNRDTIRVTGSLLAIFINKCYNHLRHLNSHS